jgi:hypothetical protein
MSQADEARELDWQAAAKRVDWMQILLNLMNGQETGRDGQPCFFIGGGYFCGRAKFWAGHDDQHKFVSLLDLLEQTALEARKAAYEEAALELTELADNLRDEAPEAMGVAWDVVTQWIAAIRSLAERVSKGAGGVK